MRTVVACVANSPAARAVLEAARAIAPHFGAEVEAVTVATRDDDVAEVRRLVAADAPGVPLRALRGGVVDVLTDAAQSPDVVTLVVGARERPHGARPAGHVALALADHSEVPVLVVPPESRTPRMQRVLIAIEGTPTNAKSLKRAVELAAGADLDLVVVHVDDESSIPSFSDQIQHETEAYAHEFLARYVPGAPRARLEPRIGIPADEILKASDAIHADLLALGWRQDAAAHHNVAREVLTHSRTPVLLVAVL